MPVHSSTQVPTSDLTAFDRKGSVLVAEFPHDPENPPFHRIDDDGTALCGSLGADARRVDVDDLPDEARECQHCAAGGRVEDAGGSGLETALQGTDPDVVSTA